MKKSRLALIAGTAVLALFLASCGKSGTASSTSSSKVKTVQIVGPSASQPYQFIRVKINCPAIMAIFLPLFKKTSKTNISSSIKSLKQTPSLWAYNLVNTIWQWAITTTRLNVLKPTTTHATLPY